MLAVIDHVETGIGLLPHDFGDGPAHAAIERALVVALAEFLGVESFDEVRWTRQASGVRRQNALITSFHEKSTDRAMFA